MGGVHKLIILLRDLVKENILGNILDNSKDSWVNSGGPPGQTLDILMFSKVWPLEGNRALVRKNNVKNPLQQSGS